MARQVGELILYLNRQLASWRDDQRPRPARWPGQQVLKRRQQEGGCLACARRRLGDQIAACQRRRDSLGLNGRGGIVPLVAHALNQAGM